MSVLLWPGTNLFVDRDENLLLAAQPRCEEGIDWTSRAWTSETRRKMYCTRTFGNEQLGKQCSSLTSTIAREISNWAVRVAEFRTWSGGRLARKLEVWDWCLFSPHWDQYMVFLGNGIVNEFCGISFVAMSISVLLYPLNLGVDRVWEQVSHLVWSNVCLVHPSTVFSPCLWQLWSMFIWKCLGRLLYLETPEGSRILLGCKFLSWLSRVRGVCEWICSVAQQHLMQSGTF